MKKFLKNLLLGIDVKLQVLSVTYKINSHNMSGLRSQVEILKSCNGQLCMYITIPFLRNKNWSLSSSLRLFSQDNDRFLRIFSWKFYLLQRVFARNLLKNIRQWNICLSWGLNRDFTFNQPTHYTLDWGELKKESNLLNKFHNGNTAHNNPIPCLRWFHIKATIVGYPVILKRATIAATFGYTVILKRVTIANGHD